MTDVGEMAAGSLREDGSYLMKLTHGYKRVYPGEALSREDFPELYEVIDRMTERAPEGEFKVPDFRGRIVGGP